jgi:hypothetical protein
MRFGHACYPQRSPSEAFHYEGCDEENNHPLIDAKVALVLWRQENGFHKKKEMESRTDEYDVAVCPRVEAENITVDVEAQGYRSV